MAGLLNGKQLVDGSVTPNKLSERYLQVNEQGEVYGDLVVNGDTTLSDRATYKGAEIATHADLYDEGGIKDLINELDEKKQDNLIAGENIQIAPDGVTISSSTKVAGSDRVLTYDTAGLKANISLVVEGNQIRVEGKTDASGDPYILGEFNVLQSQIIDKVYIEDGHLFITFIVDGDPGKEKVDIDLSEFIDIYEGSRYIDINGQEVSLKYDEVRDQLITDGMASTSQIPMDYVDRSTAQTIGGVKTFSSNIFTDSNIYGGSRVTSNNKRTNTDGIAGCVLNNGRGIFTSNPDTNVGIEAYYSGATTRTSYWLHNGHCWYTATDGVPGRVFINDNRSSLDYNFYVGGTSYFTTRPLVAGTQVALLTDIPSLSGYVTTTALNTALGNYSQTNHTHTNYVQKSGAETIEGVKTFSSRPKVNNTNVAIVSDIPSKLPNPNSINFTGGATGSYDGSGALTVTIPTAITDYVSIAGTQTISGVKTFSNVLYSGNAYYGYGRTATNDGKPGVILGQTTLYIGGASPKIEFQYNGATAATSAIQETSSGKLHISATNGISLPIIYGGSTIYSNNKTSITDGKDGIVLTGDAIHICRSAGNSLAYLTFRPNGVTSNTCYITGSSAGVIDLRGSAARPTYNGGNLALYSDIPSLTGYVTTSAMNTALATKANLSHTHDQLDVIDSRLLSHVNTQTAGFGDRKLTPHFNMESTPTGSWLGIIRMHGWNTESYASWEIGASNSSSTNNKLYFRTGINNVWNGWREVSFSDHSHTNYVQKTGAETIEGVKTFKSRPTVNGTNVALTTDIPSLAGYAKLEQTPQFGNYNTLSSLATISLTAHYDQRYTHTSGSAITMSSITGGVDGREYVITINNTSSSNLTITFPTASAYQANDATYVVHAGTIGEISIRYILNKYVIKV